MPDVLAGQKATGAHINLVTKDILPGSAIRIGDALPTSGSTLFVWATTAAVNLPADTVIRVELEARWSNTVDNEQFAFRLYDTNTSGAILSDSVEKGYGGGPYNAFCSHTFTTDSDGTPAQVFMATIHRVVGSSGTATVKANSCIRIMREGDAGTYTAV